MVGLAAGALVGCGGGVAAEESPFPGGVDCESCSGEELCTYSTDYDGVVSGGCADLPSDCSSDRSCDCVNASSEAVCGGDAFQNPCETIEDVPVVDCVTTLG